MRASKPFLRLREAVRHEMTFRVYRTTYLQILFGLERNFHRRGAGNAEGSRRIRNSAMELDKPRLAGQPELVQTHLCVLCASAVRWFGCGYAAPCVSWLVRDYCRRSESIPMRFSFSTKVVRFS